MTVTVEKIKDIINQKTLRILMFNDSKIIQTVMVFRPIVPDNCRNTTTTKYRESLTHVRGTHGSDSPTDLRDIHCRRGYINVVNPCSRRYPRRQKWINTVNLLLQSPPPRRTRFLVHSSSSNYLFHQRELHNLYPHKQLGFLVVPDIP
jgi:hypothetical protein